ncbi:MAG: riboflavin kinase [Patescibacteria group bacterium]
MPPLFKKISGTVIRGAQKGTELGFPTANIKIENEDLRGIYAGQAKVNGKNYLAAIYIGEKQKILEAYLLDFSEDIYGQVLEVTIEQKIREDRKFENQSDLLETITRDIKVVRDFYAKKP